MNTTQQLIIDLSDALTDEGSDWSQDGLDNLRKRVASALPRDLCPDWLVKYREQALLKVVS